MNNQLKVQKPLLPETEEIVRLVQYSEFTVASWLYPSIKKKEQALLLFQFWFEMWLWPAESLQSLYVINWNVNFWWSALSKRFRLFWYKIEYLEESSLSVKAKVSKDWEEYIDTARKEEVEKWNAYKYWAKAEKLRYHVLRKIAKFHVPEVLWPCQNEWEDINAFQRGETPIKTDSVEIDPDFNPLSEEVKIEKPKANPYVDVSESWGKPVKKINDKWVKELFRLVKTWEISLANPNWYFEFAWLNLPAVLIDEILSVLPEYKKWKKDTKEEIKEDPEDILKDLKWNPVQENVVEKDPIIKKVKPEWKSLAEEDPEEYAKAQATLNKQLNRTKGQPNLLNEVSKNAEEAFDDVLQDKHTKKINRLWQESIRLWKVERWNADKLFTAILKKHCNKKDKITDLTVSEANNLIDNLNKLNGTS